MKTPRQYLMALMLLGYLAFLVLGGGVVCAQQGNNKKTRVKDREQPILIDADAGTFDDQRKVQTLEHNVFIRQGTLEIQADKGIVEQLSRGGQKITLWGSPVRFKQRREDSEEWIEGSALRAEYRGDGEKLELFDDAWLKTDRNEIQSAYIIYNLKSNFAEAKGGGHGGSEKGRVKIIIQPVTFDKEPSSASSIAPSLPGTKSDQLKQAAP